MKLIKLNDGDSSFLSYLDHLFIQPHIPHVEGMSTRISLTPVAVGIDPVIEIIASCMLEHLVL